MDTLSLFGKVHVLGYGYCCCGLSKWLLVVHALWFYCEGVHCLFSFCPEGSIFELIVNVKKESLLFCFVFPWDCHIFQPASVVLSNSFSLIFFKRKSVLMLYKCVFNSNF